MFTSHVFLTRPEGRNGSVPRRLQALGMQVSELPALELRPFHPPCIPRAADYDLVVFVSRYAAQRYFALCAEAGRLVGGWPSYTLAGTVGASSALAVLEAGVPEANLVHPPEGTLKQDSEALLAMLDAREAVLQRVLIVRGRQGRDWLARTLAARGVHVDLLPVYKHVPATWAAESEAVLASALQTPQQCIFLLTSSEGVLALAQRLQDRGLFSAWSKSAFILIHERIAATLQSVLASQSSEDVRRLALCSPDDDSIVAAIRAVA